ncbi:hypothetical protein POPTR_014G107050v4 [Populus trichocarpa]|uniref:Secreted protein n=1 Tax=Populus trichocarpa TaxID=3694 RepID=A0A3N7HQN6_POPTR|nr:hypothetical protein BDE02_14G088800 [Populus trichocarpa]RQP00015.1 hypothetical protein POPTR_014G107050v4 [Populus trichocarpa]
MRLLCCHFMLNLRIDVLLGRSMLFCSIAINIQQERVMLRETRRINLEWRRSLQWKELCCRSRRSNSRLEAAGQHNS